MLSRNAVLTAPQLVLKQLEETDTDDMIRLLSDARIKKTYMIPDFEDRAHAEAFFERLRGLSADINRFIYGIFLEGKLIGFMNEVKREEGSIELGYFIDPEHWNRGYATQALKTAMKELFRMGYGTVIAGYFEENPASGRVMEKSGMQPLDREEQIEYRGKTHRCRFMHAESGLTVQ